MHQNYILGLFIRPKQIIFKNGNLSKHDLLDHYVLYLQRADLKHQSIKNIVLQKSFFIYKNKHCVFKVKNI